MVQQTVTGRETPHVLCRRELCTCRGFLRATRLFAQLRGFCFCGGALAGGCGAELRRSRLRLLHLRQQFRVINGSTRGGRSILFSCIQKCQFLFLSSALTENLT